MMQVGIMIEGQEGLTWVRWRRLAETVEALGFESLWRSDHLFSLYNMPARPGLDTWTSGSAGDDDPPHPVRAACLPNYLSPSIYPVSPGGGR